MPFDYIDDFAHQITSVAQFGGPGVGVWDTALNVPGVSFVTDGDGTWLRIAEDGVSATGIGRYLTATRERVFSGYFRASAAPSVNSTVLAVFDVGGALLANIRLDTSGVLTQQTGGGIGRSTAGSVCDGAKHLLDWFVDTTGTTWTAHAEVDGVPIATNATQTGQSGTDAVRLRFGSATATHTATIDWLQPVASSIAAAFPIGAHRTALMPPIADGTHNAGTNIIEDQTGADIGTAWSLLDEFPPNTTDYVRQNASGATNYAEVTFGQDPAGAGEAIEGVQAYFAGFASGGGAETGNPTTRIVNGSGSTLVDVYAGDMSEPALQYNAALVPVPGSAWTNADFNGLAARIGFRSNAVGADPRWSAVWLVVAIREVTTVTKSHTTTAIVSQRYTRSHTSDARITSALNTKSHTTTAIVLKTGLVRSHSTDAQISGGGARRRNSLEGGANGATVTTGNSGGTSGDAFQDVAIGADSTLTYDIAQAAHGSVSARINPGLTVAYMGYTTSIGTQTSVYGRCYIRLDSAFPAQGIAMASVLESSTQSCGRVGIGTTGRLRVFDSLNAQQGITPDDVTGKLVIGQWARVEWHFVGDAATGSVEARLFLDPASLTPDSTASATNINTFGAFSRYRVGKSNSTTVDEVVTNIDEIAWDTADWLGPVSDTSVLSHTSDARVKATVTKTQSTTAIVRKSSIVSQDADAEILSRPELSQTGDAVLTKTLGLTQTTDAYLTKPGTPSHQSDAYIAGGFTPAANSWVVVDVVATRATGVVPQPVVRDSLGTVFTVEVSAAPAGVERLGRYFAPTGTNPLPRSIVVDFGGNPQAEILVHVYQIIGASISAPFVRTFVASPIVDAADVTVNLPPYASTVNRGLIAAAHAADEASAEEAGWTELADIHTTGIALASAWSDAEDDTATYSWASTVGGIIAVASEIQVLITGHVAQTTDAVISKAATRSQTADAILTKMSVRTQTADAVIGGFSQVITQTADAYLLGVPTLSQTADAVVFGTSVVSQRSDAVIREEGVVPPPPLFPGYRLVLAQRSAGGLGSEIIGDVLDATGVLETAQLMYEEELNEAGRLEFSLPLDHALVTRANFAVGEREIHLYRADDELVWAGTLEMAEIRGWEVRFAALGWYDRLARRTVKTDYDSRSVFDGQTWTHKDQFRILRDLIDAAQAEDPIGITYYDGLAVSGVTRKLTICAEERRLISDVFESFASANNGFDFAVLPDKRLRLWFPRRDSAQPVATVDGTRTFSDVAYQIDTMELTTQVSGVGPQQECASPDIVMHSDPQAVARFGILDETIDLQHNLDDDHRTAIVDEALQQGAKPRFQTDLVIETLLPGSPDPNTYDVGDTLIVNASRGASGGFGSFSLTTRILKRRFVIGANGYETVTLTIDVEAMS